MSLDDIFIIFRLCVFFISYFKICRFEILFFFIDEIFIYRLYFVVFKKGKMVEVLGN